MSSELVPYEPVISLRNVARRYRFLEPGRELKTTLLHPGNAWRHRRGRPFSAVRDVTLDISRGEFFGVV
ncbi:MAG: hypothetical protein ACREN5_13580, partial [Gemmatimonadales bacterium]